jgi:hypothetical protein
MIFPYKVGRIFIGFYAGVEAQKLTIPCSLVLILVVIYARDF